MQFSSKTTGRVHILKNSYVISIFIVIGLASGFYFFRAFGSQNLFQRNSSHSPVNGQDTVYKDSIHIDTALPVLDTAKYDQLLRALSNGDSSGRWPVKLK